MLPPIKKVFLNKEANVHRSSTIYKRVSKSKQVLNKYVGEFGWERTTEDRLFHWKKLLSAVRWAVCIISLILTAPIHCRGSVGEKVMQCWISPTLFQWRNKRILDWPESIFSAHFRFWVNCIMIFFLLIIVPYSQIWLCTNLVTIYLFIRSQFNLFFL